MKLLAWLLAAFARRRWLVWLALRYRRWFQAENSGSHKLKLALEAEVQKRIDLRRCHQCGKTLSEGWVWHSKAHHADRCQGCQVKAEISDRVAVEISERLEAELPGDKYAVRGVSRKDFYR